MLCDCLALVNIFLAYLSKKKKKKKTYLHDLGIGLVWFEASLGLKNSLNESELIPIG